MPLFPSSCQQTSPNGASQVGEGLAICRRVFFPRLQLLRSEISNSTYRRRFPFARSRRENSAFTSGGKSGMINR